MNGRFHAASLFPLRLLVAVMLLVEGWAKLRGGWLHGDELARTTAAYLGAHKPYAFFLGIATSAHAHPKIFGSLVTFGELFVGTALALGVITRMASAVGVVMLGSFAAASGQGLIPPGNAVLMAAILFTFVIAPPGRFLGLDQRLRGKLPPFMV